MRTPLLPCLACLLVACGSSHPPVSATPAAPPTPAAAAPHESPPVDDKPEPYTPPADLPAPSPPPAPLPASSRDPQVMRLARAAASCKFESGEIDSECKAFAAWKDEEKAFAKAGNVTLLSLLEDADPKIRQIAAARRFDKPEDFFADKDNARRLVAVASKETDPVVASALGERVTRVDAEKVGLKGEFFALTKHPVKKFRENLAFYLLGHNASAFNLVVAEALMNDPDERVQEQAVGSLSTGGITKGTDGVCTLLAKQLKRTDRAGAEAHWAAGTSNCGSVFPALVDSLEKRIASMKDGKIASEYALGASSACKPRPKFDDATLASMRKRLFAVGQVIARPAQKDANTRNFGISVLVDCDPVAARPVLEAMTQEKDSFVADRARDALKNLGK